MPDMQLMPLAGINNSAEEAALKTGGDSPRLYARDVVNIDVSPMGKAMVRQGIGLATSTPYKHLWQSPLHGDVFAELAGDWVKVDVQSWTHEVLAHIGVGDVSHTVLNNKVCVAGREGIFCFDGSTASRLSISTPPMPFVMAGGGALDTGKYGVSVSWLRGTLESAPSEIAFIDVEANGSIEVTPPFVSDSSVTSIRLYITKQNGGELARVGDYALTVPSISLPLLPKLGMPPQFINSSPMPTGKHLKYWRGRIITATAGVVRFSEPMAYHVHDERHGFVQLPQRVTFVEPVDGGLWVGQVDHVVFLQGDRPDTLTIQRKAVKPPVPGSSILVGADVVGGELSQGGEHCALWLAENGYVVGTSSGQAIEIQTSAIKDISANYGTSVVLEDRVLTTVL